LILISGLLRDAVHFLNTSKMVNMKRFYKTFKLLLATIAQKVTNAS
jgi:hypothetical protein